MIIIKNLGQDTFSWNPKVFNNRGHWFLLSETGGYIRISTKNESMRLGKPKPSDMEKIDDDTDKKMSYQKANQLRKKSLKSIITEKIVSGEGVGSSIGRSMSEKMQARTTGLKEKFDPLNIAKMLTGKLGSALLGKITGRSKEDISYFAGDKSKSKEKIPQSKNYTNENSSKSDTALYSAVGDGNQQSFKKGDGIATVLARLYNIIKLEQKNSNKRFQLEKNFRKIRQKDKEKWNKELAKSLGLRKSVTLIKEDKKTDDTSSIFDIVGKLISGAIAGVMALVSNLWNGLWSIISPIAEWFGIKKIIDLGEKVLGGDKKVESKPKTSDKTTPKEMEKKAEKATEKVTTKTDVPSEEDKKTKDQTKEAVDKGKEKVKEEKEKDKATKVKEEKEKPKAKKVSAAAKGAKGVLKYLTKIPFIAQIGNAIETIAEIKTAIADHEEGSITDSELKKKVVEAVGGLAGGAGGASLGAVIGTTVAGPIGTFLGAAAGVVAGQKIGSTASGMLFDKIANSTSEVVPDVTVSQMEKPKTSEPVANTKPSETKQKIPTPSSAETSSSTPKATPVTPTITPVATPNSTETRLQSTVSENEDLKMNKGATVSATSIDNSQVIGSASGGGGGVSIDSSISPRNEESTLMRVQKSNMRSF